MDLAGYRTDAERFIAELGLEYYRHYAGLAEDLALEPIYERHAGLFEGAAVEALRARAGAAPSGEDEGRRLRALLDFAAEGRVGRATAALDAELARREAALHLDVDGERLGFRESSIVQANEPDAERRARIEAARLEATVRELNPLRREVLDLQEATARALGWPGYRAMCEECKGLGLDAIGRQADAFLAATDGVYPDVVEPALRAAVGVGLDRARRSDLPRFFRFAAADDRFPQDRLLAAYETTFAGLGIDVGEQEGIVLDVESRPGKSPRAFCAPVRAPGEVYLVVPPAGGRDDYAALLHEGGHAQHYGGVDPGLAFEFRHLGDNSVTEAYAFLLDGLLDDPEWLRRTLGVRDGDDRLAAHARAQRLVMLRRYAAKVGYELGLHGDADGNADPAVDYSSRLTRAVGVDWPAELHLVDVDPGFYVAAYLRAWALEAALRAHLQERFGPAWFAEPEAGELLRSLWAQGQRLDAAELLAELTGAELDLAVLVP
jgi:hypothetical protein